MMKVSLSRRPSPYATATTFPSTEYVDEKCRDIDRGSGPAGVVAIGPPVWRSHKAMPSPRLNDINRRLSGERLSHSGYMEGDAMESSRWRVAASRTSIDSNLATATKPPPGDHIDFLAKLGSCLVMTPASQEVGNPRATLAKGWAYCLYDASTIDVRGDRGSAE